MGKLALKISPAAFKKAKAEFANGDDFGNVELENGRYNASVHDVRTIKDDGVVIDFWFPEANDGQGGKASIMYKTTEDRLAWLLRDVAKMGIDASESVDAIGEALEALLAEKPTVRIKVTHTGEYQNLRIEKLVDSDEGSINAANTVAKGGKAGIADTAPAAVKTQAAKTVPATKTKPPAPPADEEVVADKDEEIIDDTAPPAAAEETVEIKAGLKCKAVIQGQADTPVTVVEVDEAASKVTVEVVATKKKYKIAAEKLSL